jgi:hypothetical protein
VGICVHSWPAADGNHGDGDGNGIDNDSDGDGMGDGDYITRHTSTSRFATSMSASKLPQS